MHEPPRRLQVNDVIVRESATGALSEYVVEGWSPRGRLIMRRKDTGTLRKAWWTTDRDLPRRYRRVEA